MERVPSSSPLIADACAFLVHDRHVSYLLKCEVWRHPSMKGAELPYWLVYLLYNSLGRA